MKRTPLLPKKSKRLRAAEAVRSQWIAARGCETYCWFPGCGHALTDTHEMLRGPCRQAAMLHPAACCMRFCREHHEEVGGWPLHKQLALHAIVAPLDYDPALVFSLKFPDMTLANFIAERAKIEEYVQQLEARR